MYLKSIEVQGFKSFANKIRFDFRHGITGIVGPNGSGKSNVGDAVRWVLGEQSAKSLRGGNMQDVIFAGTELRKPQGFAYVAITLDNADRALSLDYDEVKVSRRLYRSGESEYMLNGSPCRLKDINELFFDTGIGQEGYSIIGQGQVERILSGKAEERRELFDEAAGITKFRKRKALAEKKLENEQANMLRVGDILSELEKQVGPLEQQAATAREYLTLREELKEFDLNLFLTETGALREELKELSGREEILAGDAESTEQDAARLKAEYEELEQQLSQLEEALTAARDTLGAVHTEEGQLSGQVNVLKEQINTERANAEHIASRLATILADMKERESERSRFDARKTEAAQAVAAADRRAEEAEWELVSAEEEIMILDQKIQDLKNAVMDTVNERAEVVAKGQRYEAMLEQVQLRSSETANRLLKLKTEEAALDEELRTENQNKELLRARRADLRQRRETAGINAEALEKETGRLGSLLREAQSRYQAQSVKLESLRNLAERYDGYGNSIRRVMEARDRIHGIHGVVADLIAVDKKYETAIETALGGRIQNVVTDSEETAKRLIEHLKKNRFGRATFLPLTSAGSAKRWDAGAVLKEPGVIGIAAALVTTEPQYEGLVKNLLGRDIVVSDIDRAIAIERKYHYAYRIVTTDGELLNPGGSMSGGAFRNSSNLLGRKREIEELEAEIEKILKKSEQSEQELKEARERLNFARQEIETLRTEEQDVLLRWNTQEMLIRRLAEKKGELSGQLSDLQNERGQLTMQADEIGESRNDVSENVGALEEKRADMEERIASLSNQLEEERRRRETLAAELSEAQLAAGTAGQQNSFLEENLSRVSEELQKLAAERSLLEGGTGDTEKRIAERERQIQEAEARITALHSQKNVLEEQLQALSGQKSARSEEQKRYFEKRDEIAGRKSALERDLFRVRGQREKAEEKLQSRESYILGAYNLTEEGAKQYRNESYSSVPQMKKEIEIRKAGIKALGNVNVNAIEDYRQLSERYGFLKTQHEDLKKAEAALVTVIGELDRGMRKQFSEQFECIRREFNKVFRELFGGGKGELQLDAEADLLEASISIIAEPPGKKLQNMMQLSGGEKALTAISLLFAIQNLKPSPFALLDEIEAALDDSNVDRYAQYLRKLTRRTQFIVITHRRGTMVAADRLYGITMQEKGVSTLVSVSLIEDQLDA